jgi:two-component system, OmpR family, sensor histidine kinase BaeS
VAFTLPIVAVSLWRLVLYERMYGFTELRVAATWGTVVCAGWLVVLAVSRWTPRLGFGSGAVGFTALALLALNALNPDAAIARANLERVPGVVALDVSYLITLSADAAEVVAPALAKEGLPEARAEYLARVTRGSPSFASWRWARARAAAAR